MPSKLAMFKFSTDVLFVSFQATFHNLQIEKLYQCYCVQLKHSLTIALVTLAMAMLLGTLIYHIVVKDKEVRIMDNISIFFLLFV